MEIGVNGHLDIELLPRELFQVQAPNTVLDASGRLVFKVEIESAEHVDVRILVDSDTGVKLALLRVSLSLGIGKRANEQPFLLGQIEHRKLNGFQKKRRK